MQTLSALASSLCRIAHYLTRRYEIATRIAAVSALRIESALPHDRLQDRERLLRTSNCWRVIEGGQLVLRVLRFRILPLFVVLLRTTRIYCRILVNLVFFKNWQHDTRMLHDNGIRQVDTAT